MQHRLAGLDVDTELCKFSLMADNLTGILLGHGFRIFVAGCFLRDGAHSQQVLFAMGQQFHILSDHLWWHQLFELAGAHVFQHDVCLGQHFRERVQELLVFLSMGYLSFLSFSSLAFAFSAVSRAAAAAACVASASFRAARPAPRAHLPRHRCQ